MKNAYRKKMAFCKKCGSLNLEVLDPNIPNENSEEDLEKVVLKCCDCGQTFTNSDVEKAKRLSQVDLKQLMQNLC